MLPHTPRKAKPWPPASGTRSPSRPPGAPLGRMPARTRSRPWRPSPPSSRQVRGWCRLTGCVCVWVGVGRLLAQIDQSVDIDTDGIDAGRCPALRNRNRIQPQKSDAQNQTIPNTAEGGQGVRPGPALVHPREGATDVVFFDLPGSIESTCDPTCHPPVFICIDVTCDPLSSPSLQAYDLSDWVQHHPGTYHIG